MLRAWGDKPVSLQPCIGDVWHDHILFEGERISGVIDFGAARLDHRAADVGRLIGSLVGDDESAWATAIAAYRTVRPLSWEAEAFARLLDRSGIVVSLFNWLRWCGRGERKFEDTETVAAHLAGLVKRVEGWSDSSKIAQVP
jgi:homoserine kinase type II